jgi:chemotaxis-related protein WspB
MNVLFLLFELDRERYALDTAAIGEVLPLLEIRAVPRAPAAVAGVFDYRGVTVPVIDLSELALGRPAARRLSTRIVLVRHTDAQGTERQLGLIAERATSTLSCDESSFQHSGLSRAGAPYLGPIATLPGGLVQRIELQQLLTPALCAAFFEPARET